MKGSELIGLAYEPIVDDFLKLPEVKNNPAVYHTYPGDYVEITAGTGIVTINGSYGEIDMEAAKALDAIRKRAGIPVVADIHFDHRLALVALDAGIDGLRINPGNIGGVKKGPSRALCFQNASG